MRSRRRKGKEGEGGLGGRKKEGGLGRRLLLEIKLMAFSRIIREPKQLRRRRLRKHPLKSEFTLPQTLTCLFHLVQFVQCWQTSLEFNSKALLQSTGKEEESRCLLFTSSSKLEIRHFHVVVVQ